MRAPIGQRRFFRPGNRRRGAAGTVVVILLVLALIVGGAWYFVWRSTPQKTVRMMLEAARVNDEETMKDYLTERSPEGASLVTALSLRLAGDAGGEPQYTIEEPEMTGERATVPVTFPIGDVIGAFLGRDEVTVPYVLHRENRRWLVDTADTTDEIGSRIAETTLDALKRFLFPGGGPEPSAGDV
jgi:hypothetical protein